MSKVVNIHKKNGKRPYFDIYIGRKTNRTEFKENSKWANLFYRDLKTYEQFVRDQLWDDLDKLKNKILGCWCINTDKTTPIVCHGQILLKLIEEKEASKNEM